jgi:hypothetical protein
MAADRAKGKKTEGSECRSSWLLRDRRFGLRHFQEGDERTGLTARYLHQNLDRAVGHLEWLSAPEA